jgi:GT2 family glycosyltransferase
MASTPTISLLITSHNRRSELLRTLSVMVPLLLPDNEVIVLDDGSSDGTFEAVAQAFPQVLLIRSERRTGYITGRNQLLERARGSYALSLDDDAEIVTPDFIAAILAYFAAHPRCAVMALRVYWGRALPIQALSPDEAPRRVKSFVGCGHVWRLDAWRSIPHYPEWFEMYGEEDFAACQLLRHGWEVHFVPHILVHHRVDIGHRPTQERAWRYRRQLRAGLYIMLLFYPFAVLPKYIAYALWTQIRLRLLREHNWAVNRDLLWVLKELLWNCRRIRSSRARLSALEWAAWKRLSPTIIYWKPSEEP